MTVDRPRWQERAACRDVDDDRFYRDSDPEPALRMCRACPVLAECRADTLRLEARVATAVERSGRRVVSASAFWGVAGGLLAWERYEAVAECPAPRDLRYRGTRHEWGEAAS